MKTKLLAASMLLLAACYPQGPEYVEDADIVYTTYEPEYDFTDKQTYAMPDKIVVDVDIKDGDTTVTYMKDIYATPILAAIEANMNAYGWDRVGVNQDPDLLLTPGGITSTTFYYSYWYDWWYGGYWGGWGWYYPPYYTVSSYTTGTMIMVLADPNQSSNSPINRSPALWLSAANGLLTGYSDINRVTNSINQSFKQSPYLKIN